MDYIIKFAPDLDERIAECIDNAYEKYKTNATPVQKTFRYLLGAFYITSHTTSMSPLPRKAKAARYMALPLFMYFWA